MINTKKNNKILIGVTLDGKCGLDSYVEKFCAIANKKGFSCDVLTTKFSDEYKKRLLKYNAKLINIANLHDKKSIYNTMVKLHKSNNYNTAYWNISTAMMYPYIKQSANLKIPNIIVHSHAAKTDKSNKILSIIYNFVHYYYRYKINNIMIKRAACSNLAAKWMFGDKIAKSNQFTFVPNPIDVNNCSFNVNIRNQYRKNLKVEDKLVLGCVTSFLPAKNPLFVIDIAKEMQKKINNLQLLICAEGPLKKDFEAKANALLKPKSWKILGYRNDVSNLLQAFDVFVFPSKYEGLGMALVEAQAASLPSICNTCIPKEAIVISNLVNIEDNFDAKKWSKSLEKIDYKKLIRNTNDAKTIFQAGFNLDSPEKILKLIKN